MTNLIEQFEYGVRCVIFYFRSIRRGPGLSLRRRRTRRPEKDRRPCPGRIIARQLQDLDGAFLNTSREIAETQHMSSDSYHLHTHQHILL
jgi:hypothetical protein